MVLENVVSFQAHDENKPCFYEWSKNEESHGTVSSHNFHKAGEISYNVGGGELAFTPHISLSPIVNESSAKIGLLFATSAKSSSIDTWKLSSCSRGGFEAEYLGLIQFATTTKNLRICCEDSGNDVDKIVGDVSNFYLYVTHLDCSSVKYIKMPTRSINAGKMSLQSGEFGHDSLQQPAAVASIRRGNTGRVATLDALSGSICIFTKEISGYCLSARLEGQLSPCFFICFDNQANLWALSFEKDFLLCFDPESKDPKVHNNFNQMSGQTVLFSSKKTTLIGCCPKHNRVVALQSSEGKLHSTELFGPCSVFRPLTIASSACMNLLVISARSPTTNAPSIAIFDLNDFTQMC